MEHYVSVQTEGPITPERLAEAFAVICDCLADNGNDAGIIASRKSPSELSEWKAGVVAIVHPDAPQILREIQAIFDRRGLTYVGNAPI